MSKQNNKNIIVFQLIRPLSHVLIVGLLYVLAYMVRSRSDAFAIVDINTPWIATQELLLYGVISLIVFLLVGIIQQFYDILTFKKFKAQDFLRVWGQWMIITTFIAYFGQGWLFQSGVSRFIILFGIIGVLVLIPLFDIMRGAIFDRWIQSKKIQVRILLEDESQRNIVNQFSFPSYYDITTDIFNNKLLTAIDESIIILVGSYDDTTLQTIIDKVRLYDKQIYHVGNNYFLQDIVYTHANIAGVLAMRYTPSQIEGRNSIFKRIFDIVASSIGIVLSSPIMLLSALAIKLDTKGPVFYRQERVGKNGQNFLFTKFRSMHTHLSVGEAYGGDKADKIYSDLVNSHANVRPGELPKIKDDPRVTKVGKRLRATSIDELPNLFAVFLGHMSLVGPRPHLPSEIKNYKPRQQRVLSIKPGITGYAQIHGRDTLSFDQEASRELEYIQNRSLRLDMYIIVMTFKVIFIGKGK